MNQRQRLAYLANIRYPTEKAHGLAITKMCEALAGLGPTVTLYHPRRQQPPALRGQDAFAYYATPPLFAVEALPNLDVVRWERTLPARLYRMVYGAHGWLWGRYAARCAAQRGADLFYTRDVMLAYWLTRLGLPTVYEAHAVPGGRERSLCQTVLAAPSLRAAVVLTSSIRASFLTLGAPPAITQVEPSAVDLRWFAGLPSQAEARAQLGVPDDRPVVGYAGRFQMMGMEKGIAGLIQAIGVLAKQGRNPPRLLCVGGPLDATPDYYALAARVGAPAEYLHFVDRAPSRQVPLWLRTFDIATLPHPTTEHYARHVSPLKLFEYMAATLPILATDQPSFRDILRHDGNGWLVAPDDPAALAAGMAALLDDPARAARLATQAQRDVQQHTWPARAQRVLSLAGFTVASATASAAREPAIVEFGVAEKESVRG
jgi:glycosyltransferase involved in cell wall biosynthesis